MFAFAKFGHIYATYYSTRVAPVKRTLATMVVLGSFSAALILLSPSAIFSSDFAPSTSSTHFQPK